MQECGHCDGRGYTRYVLVETRDLAAAKAAVREIPNHDAIAVIDEQVFSRLNDDPGVARVELVRPPENPDELASFLERFDAVVSSDDQLSAEPASEPETSAPASEPALEPEPEPEDPQRASAPFVLSDPDEG